MDIGSLVDSVGAQFRDKPAILEIDRATTHGELARRSAALATALADQGVGPGSVVALAVGNRAEHLVSLLAIARTGAAAMAVDPLWTEGEIAEALGRFEARLAIVDDDHPAAAAAARAAGIASVAVQSPVFSGWCAGASRQLPAPSADSVLFIMLSSGTTGRPKGAAVSRAAMAFRFTAQVVEFGFSSSDRFLSLMPTHSGGGRSFSLTHLYLGGSVVLVRRFDPAAVCGLVRDFRPTGGILVPTMAHRILALPGLQPWVSMRVLISSGAPLGQADREGVLARLTPNLWDYYGSVEAGGISILRPEDHALHPGSVGRPMWGTQPVLGVGGVVRYRSPGLVQGYLGGDNSAFVNGWYETGDAGRIDADGFLYLTGRVKEMIISGGTNVYPAEVEAALLGHPGVLRCAVVGVPDPEWGERVVAAVVVQGQAPSDLDEFARRVLAPAKRPKQFFVVEELPETTEGKIDRAAIRALAG